MRSLKFQFILLFIGFICFFGNAQQQVKVYTVGAMNDMGKNNFKTQVWLDTLPKTDLFGMGPYDRMKGEIMVFEGKPFYASAFEAGKAVVSQSWDIRSPFFVYANVQEWKAYELPNHITSLDDIQQNVASIAQQHGYDIKEPFPF
ncbi:MAG: acetolactate decarboxylase, partial [Flavobacteriaceae bacterium]